MIMLQRPVVLIFCYVLTDFQKNGDATPVFSKGTRFYKGFALP